MSNSLLKIAVPNKGRLKEPTLELLKKIDLCFTCTERQLSCLAQNPDLEILFVAASCIPLYVQQGLADLGITGYDLVKEKAAQVEIIKKLGYGQTTLVLAAGQQAGLRQLSDLNGKRVATSFPLLTKNFLREQKITAEVIEVEGAVEIAPRLGIAEAISDLVSSGETLKSNNLEVLQKILDSETVLIANKILTPAKKQILSSLTLRLTSVLTAKQKKFLTLNADQKILPQIKNIIPGLTAPTVLPLAQSGLVAVQSIIDASESWPIIEQLKILGARDIVLSPVEKVIY
jgi:ATP phosphoribosyltransferase